LAVMLSGTLSRSGVALVLWSTRRVACSAAEKQQGDYLCLPVNVKLKAR